MPTITILEDLFRYNRWANDRLLALCDKLTDAQLDERRELGFGSLRNTLFHILAAEEIWWERWAGQPIRPFETDAHGFPLVEIAARLRQVETQRQVMLDQERSDHWQRLVTYKNAKGDSFCHPLHDLVQHVANHGIHHRAQALSYLKQFGRTVPGGLDYIFFRLAKPFVKQAAGTVETLRQFGLEIDSEPGLPVAWDANVVRKYFAYGDWANARLLELAATLDDAALDRPWDMGMGTIRKTALHVFDAENWWLKNWTTGPTSFDRCPETTPLSHLREGWQRLIVGRNSFIAALNAEASQRVITGSFGGPPMNFPIIESLVQLGGHGTHHRAQLVNMMRHSGITVPGIDFIVWLRETPLPTNRQ